MTSLNATALNWVKQSVSRKGPGSSGLGDLFSGSSLMLVSTIVANMGNYIYHLLMGRMLGPEGYGTLASVISLVYLFFILISTFNLVVVKFVAGTSGKRNLSGASYFASRFQRQAILPLASFSLLIICISPLIARFLHIHSPFPVAILGFLFLTSGYLGINRSILRGLLLFKQFMVCHITETSLKVLVGLFLVGAGLGVNGAVLALIVAGFGSFIVARLSLKFLQAKSAKKPIFDSKAILKFTAPVFLFQLSFISLYTSDLILVKHFFLPYEAGLYASLATLGRIIVFIANPISFVLFPLVAKRHTKGKGSSRLLWFSLGLVFIIALVGVILYYSFPHLMINLLFGLEYSSAAPGLFLMAIFMALHALSFVLGNYFLSIENTRVVIFWITAAIAQVILITLFHQTLFQVIKNSIYVSALLLMSLLLYLIWDLKLKNKPSDG